MVFQMGAMNGGGWNGGVSAEAWAARNLPCSRDQMRYPNEFRSIKVINTPTSYFL